MNGELLFELIQVAVGQKDCLSRIPTEDEWRQLFEEATRQALVGVLLSGIEKLNDKNGAVKPPRILFCEWYGTASQIEEANKTLNDAAVQLSSIFRNGGIRCCVLKGQGMAMLYPKPLRRQSGDIDLWVEGSREHTLSFLERNNLGIGKVVIHHTDTHIIEGVDTEIHFLPMWLYNPFYNRHLQAFYKRKGDEQFSHFDSQIGFCYPTCEFNGVHILVHCFHHLLDEGIGLRQVIDYYYVLKRLTAEERKEVFANIAKIGCKKFAGAMMYVLAEICALDHSLMICEPDAKRGKRFLNEIMMTGNFGQYDERFEKSAHESAYRRNKRKSVRWMQLVKDYPSEVLCIPAWKLWHWCWRKWKGYN